MESRHGRVPVLYFAPWVDVGGADKGTLDWFRFLDRSRFAPSLITTQPSRDQRLVEVERFAEEVWELPQVMRGDDFPRFIFAFIESRQVEVVHVMNSRLAFDLLPLMSTLEERPRIVVQLHVDEPDRSLYVRYVTTRYGNLVDAFSLSSEALSRRVGAYGVPSAKRRVIRTGVDAQREFNPQVVTPIEGLDRERLQILFPARLTAQKDPLLMVDVAARLRAARVPFQIHVLGDGDLADDVRRRIATLGLENEVLMHGESGEVARWYAASDLVLLTSRFEGLPYVAYEAMAMRVPVVMPDLPGLDELITPATGVLVSDPRHVAPYADAIAELAAAPARRRHLGEAARARVLDVFSLERMGTEHGSLYEELLDRDRPRRKLRPSPNGRPAAPGSTRVTFRGRRPGSRPLVSVIVPCFNHGAFLPECLDSIGRQRYESIETIVADDGSTDSDTLAVLDQVERNRAVSVLRLPVNRGPGAARNAALKSAVGRYVLPLDADNLLLPNAIDELVHQLNNAGERIGFIYPNLQYFGNREDYREAPSYNLHALLGSNLCDTASLIDRDVFDRGLRYSEYPGLINEDWEFALALAEREIYGEPARKPTVLFRKRGFTRSDLVSLSSSAIQLVAGQHPTLSGEMSRIKAEWNPSVTVIALDPLPDLPGDALPRLVAAAERQSCTDFELIVATAREPWPTDLGPRLRRIPAALVPSRARALAWGLRRAIGRYVLATYGSVASLLADAALIEKLLRVLEGDRDLAGVGLAAAGPGRPGFRLLDPDEVAHATLHAFCWRSSEPGSRPVGELLAADQPLEALAGLLGFQARVQWRQLSPGENCPAARPHHQHVSTEQRGDVAVVLEQRPHIRGADAPFRAALARVARCPPALVAAMGSQGPWMPPQTRLLYRHQEQPSGRFTYGVSQDDPSFDSTLSHVLGALRALPLPVTKALTLGSDGVPVVASSARLDHPSLLGFIEQIPLPLLDTLSIGRHQQTGEQVLVAGHSDPLAGLLEGLSPIGFIEPYPIHPQTRPHTEALYGLVGLVRSVDSSIRRHRYRAGAVPRGVLAGELGALVRDPAEDRDPLWIDEHGFVFGAGQPLGDGRPSLVTTLRWTGAPMTWSKFGRFAPKLRATARRAYDSSHVLLCTPAKRDRPATPAGYLLRSPKPYTVPLYGALHPVTGDQLLSTDPAEAAELGYQDPLLLGHLVAEAPVTGWLGPIRATATWTHRFGIPAGAR